MTRNPGETIFLVAVLAALAGLCFFLAPPGLQTNLEGVHYVQMKNFSLNGALAIDAPAFRFGFEPKDLAGPRDLFESRGDRLYAVPPPLFPFVASLFHPVFGERSVDFTPVLFVFLAALSLGVTLDRMMPRGVLHYLLLALFLGGSPVLLLAFRFTGQSLALLLIVMGLFLLVRYFKAGTEGRADLAGSSFLAGVSVLASLDFLFAAFSYLLSAGTVLALQKRWRELAAYAAGAALALATIVLHDAIFHGGFPGSYLKLMLPFYGLSGIRFALFAGSMVLSLVLLAASRGSDVTPVGRAVMTVLPVLLMFAAVLLSAARITVSHLMAFFPAVLFGFYGFPGRMDRLMRREETLEPILVCTVILGVLCGAVIHRPVVSRVLAVWLPLVPFVVLLLGADHRRIFDSRGMYVVLLFFGGVALLNSFQDARTDLWMYKDYNARRIEFLKQHTSAGDVILFSEAGSMEHAGPLFFDRVFLVSGNPGERERLIRRLRERGIDGIYVWTTNPLSIGGGNPYDGQSPPAFMPPPRAKSCCRKSCKQKNVYLVRLEPRASRPRAAGRGGL